MYELHEVVKNYPKGHGTVRALQGVDLVIPDGEWVAIQGPTGHGKSTLLYIIGALDRPTSGTVRLGGQDLASLPETKLTGVRARSIGFVFQSFQPDPDADRRRERGNRAGPAGHRRGRPPRTGGAGTGLRRAR